MYHPTQILIQKTKCHPPSILFKVLLFLSLLEREGMYIEYRNTTLAMVLTPSIFLAPPQRTHAGRNTFPARERRSASVSGKDMQCGELFSSAPPASQPFILMQLLCIQHNLRRKCVLPFQFAYGLHLTKSDFALALTGAEPTDFASKPNSQSTKLYVYNTVS